MKSLAIGAILVLLLGAGIEAIAIKPAHRVTRQADCLAQFYRAAAAQDTVTRLPDPNELRARLEQCASINPSNGGSFNDHEN